MSRPRRISELELTTSPELGDLTVLASNGQSKRTTVGSFGTSVLNANFPITSSGIQVNGDLNVDGNLTISTLVSASVLYESGSSIFGNTLDDTHQFTGSVLATGSVSVDGSVSVGGPSILGNSLDNTHQLTGSISVTGSVSIDDVLALTPRATSLPTDVPAGSIMVSGSGITLAPYFWNGTSWVSMI